MQHPTTNQQSNNSTDAFTKRRELLLVNRDAVLFLCDFIGFDKKKLPDNLSALLLSDISNFLDDTGLYALPQADDLLVNIGRRIFDRPMNRYSEDREIRRVVHITTATEETGGHTRAICRWIASDPTRQYSVLLTNQTKPIPEQLKETVQTSGGTLYKCDTAENDISRAKQIFSLLDNRYDAAVLQLYSGDNSALLTFCRNGGPPVAIYNTADHKAFLGNSIVDVVIDIRNSGADFTAKKRETQKQEILPLPITRNTSSNAERETARSELSIRPNDVLILTIGSEYKYRPIPGLNFFEAVKQIVDADTSIRVIAVGPKSTDNWEKLNRLTNGRVNALGIQTSLDKFYAAADVYIEGFPFGSLTALLDARERGLPCILAPQPITPPFSSDSPGISDLNQPECIQDYITKTINTCKQAKTRCLTLSTTQMQSHYGSRWQSQLEKVFGSFPTNHGVKPSTATTCNELPEYFWSIIQQPIDESLAENNLWTRILSRLHGLGIVDNSIEFELYAKAVRSITTRCSDTEMRRRSLKSLNAEIRNAGISLKSAMGFFLLKESRFISNPKFLFRLLPLIPSLHPSFADHT